MDGTDGRQSMDIISWRAKKCDFRRMTPSETPTVHIIPRSIFHLLHLGHVYCSVLSWVCQLFIKELHDDDDDDDDDE